MNNDSRSTNCPEVTDQSAELTPEMTDNFLQWFFSKQKIIVSVYLKDDTSWQWPDHPEIMISPRTFAKYERFVNNLPTLLKELV